MAVIDVEQDKVSPTEDDFKERAGKAEKEIEAILNTYDVRFGTNLVYAAEGIGAKVVFVDVKKKEEAA